MRSVFFLALAISQALALVALPREQLSKPEPKDVEKRQGDLLGSLLGGVTGGGSKRSPHIKEDHMGSEGTEPEVVPRQGDLLGDLPLLGGILGGSEEEQTQPSQPIPSPGPQMPPPPDTTGGSQEEQIPPELPVSSPGPQMPPLDTTGGAASTPVATPDVPAPNGGVTEEGE